MKIYQKIIGYCIPTILVLIFLTGMQAYWESHPASYWVEYISVEPEYEVFPYGAYASFDSTTVVHRPATYTYKEILLCDLYNGKGFTHQYTRLIPGSKSEPSEQRTGAWTYGEFALPERDSTCLVTSKFCVDTPFFGKTCEDLVISAFDVRDIEDPLDRPGALLSD